MGQFSQPLLFSSARCPRVFSSPPRPCWCLLATTITSGTLLSQERARTAAELLPTTTIGYTEIAQPGKLLDLALEHPLRKKVEATKQYKQYLASKNYRQLLLVVLLAERQLGMKWQDATKSFVENGIYLGFDTKTQGAVLLVRGKNKESIARIRDTLFRFIEAEAKRKNQPSPIKSDTYRGFKAYRAANARVAVLNDWVVVTNKPALGKSIIDRYVDGGKSLAGNANFKKAYSSSQR